MLRIAFATLLLLPLTVNARDWTTDTAQSTLGFSGTYQGGPFDGAFKKFEATIRYDPDDLAAAKFDVTVDMTSVDTQSSERDQTLAGSDFFETGKFPTAHFVTTSFRRDANGGVQAEGTLTIRGSSQPVTLQVNFSATGNDATLDVKTTLDRLDFSLGHSADWNDIGRQVDVHGHLVLHGQP
ncbi:MAG: YceI family protein [Rhodanobacteraceae bacterium]